jgi:GNAT superfamily N-acetyltransferase
VVTIREAIADDTPEILALIRELAAYEKLGHEVVATENDLRTSLFTERGAEVVLALVSGNVAGFALFFHNYSTFLGKRGIYLEDLYVRPAFRRNGVGRALLRHLAGLALARNCGRLEWWVLDWNHDAIAFYRSIGAEPMSDWTVQRVSGPALEQLAGLPVPYSPG